MERSKILNQIGVFFVTCLFILLSSQMVNAATYYVRTDGNDTRCTGLVDAADTGSGSSQPCGWLTIQHASSTAACGDTVIVDSGSYAETTSGITISKACTAGTVFTIQAQTKWGAITTNSTLQWVVTGNYITIDGFKSTGLRNTANASVFINGGNHNIVQNFWIEDNHDTGIMVYYLDGSHLGSYNTVTNNYLKDMQLGIDLGGYNNTISNNEIDGLYWYGGANGGDCDYARYHRDNHVFSGNYFHSGSGGLDICHANGAHIDCWQTFTEGPSPNSNNILIERNRCYDSDEGVMASASTGTSDGLTIRNNIFYNQGAYGVAAYNTTNVKVYNNDFISWRQYGVGCVTSPATCDVRNNIFYDGPSNANDSAWYTSGGAAWITPPANNLLYSVNITYVLGSGQNQYAVGNIVNQDPKFTSPSDFSLLVGSSAINAGVNLSASFTNDFPGNTRPTSTGTWDIGAYQYETSNQSTLLVTSVNGTVTSNPSGINCGSTCSANYDSETSVTLTASPNSGYTFTGWSGGGCSGTSTCTVTMNAATSVTATFATTAYSLTVTKSGTGSGTVTGSDGLINCGSTCSVNYASGRSVTLAASATSGSTFSGWSGACSGTGPCTVTMTAATSVAATFTPVYNLTVSKSVAAAGTVTSSDSTINCGSTCSANYNPGTSVILTAWSNSGYTFTGWLGGGCSGTGTCTVSMTAATSVTATFATSVYNLAVTKSGTGSGTVTGSDGLVNCGSTCSVNYESGKSVNLAASATSGSTFSGWSGGGCSGTGTCAVTMTAAKSVAATFATNLYNLTVTKSGTGSGTVTSSPYGISCGSTCSANYTYGTVTLAASAASGSTFSGWSGACYGTGTCTVTMTAAKSVAATFARSMLYSKKRR